MTESSNDDITWPRERGFHGKAEEREWHIRNDEEATAWELARNDPEFVAETVALESAFGRADRETWPAFSVDAKPRRARGPR